MRPPPQDLLAHKVAPASLIPETEFGVSNLHEVEGVKDFPWFPSWQSVAPSHGVISFLEFF